MRPILTMSLLLASTVLLGADTAAAQLPSPLPGRPAPMTAGVIACNTMSVQLGDAAGFGQRAGARLLLACSEFSKSEKKITRTMPFWVTESDKPSISELLAIHGSYRATLMAAFAFLGTYEKAWEYALAPSISYEPIPGTTLYKITMIRF